MRYGRQMRELGHAVNQTGGRPDQLPPRYGWSRGESYLPENRAKSPRAFREQARQYRDERARNRAERQLARIRQYNTVQTGRCVTDRSGDLSTQPFQSFHDDTLQETMNARAKFQ